MKLKKLGFPRRMKFPYGGQTWIGNIDHILDGEVEGWIKHADQSRPVQVDIALNDRVIARDLLADRHRADVAEAGIGDGHFGFSCRVPTDATLDGAKLEVRMSASQQVLLMKTVTLDMVRSREEVLDARIQTSKAQGSITPPAAAAQSPCEGRIEDLTDGILRGWASDTNQRGRVFEVDVLVDGIFLTRLLNNQKRGDLVRHGKSEGLGGYQVNLFLAELEPGEHSVTVVLPDGQQLIGNVNTEGNKRRYPLNAGLAQILSSQTVIIVPIYNAADDLDICIRRLTQYTPSNMEILLIDDASPDPRIARILIEAEKLRGFTVMRNDKNLGFTRTINRGLEEIGHKHAILLNSDARVTPGWAQGMLRAATSRPRVATVTAMSDRAGAFSAPKIGNNNPLPDGVDEITYARAFRKRSLGLYPVVPTGNGFCMFINRDCINDVGPLDAQAFPRGYGEENDFCMRAGRAGWNHLIDDRTYVFHDRSKSFGDSKADLMAAGRQIVDQRYPEYKTAIKVFTSSAELAMARFRASQAIADCSGAKAGQPVILYVVATQTGGTPQTNMDLMQEVSDEMAPWLLHCDSIKMTLSRLEGNRIIEIRSHVLSEPVNALTHRSGEYDAVLCDWLEIANPLIVHIRHLAWQSLSLPALAKARGSKVVFSFHDFYTLCPTVKLLDENNVFCGGTCTKSRGECSIELWDQKEMPHIKHSWVHIWRQRFADVLKVCDAYVTTSTSARERIAKQLNLDLSRFFVIPHGRSFTKMEQLRQHPSHGEPVRILVPGNISAAKGRDVITALLEHDRAGLFEFHILGKISNPGELAEYRRLKLHGSYQREAFSQRVAQIRPHLGAMFSIWDETYCHTVTEMWSAGVPTIVFDFPTVASRVRDSQAGWVVAHENIAQLYNKLVEISFDNQAQIDADLAILRWQSGHGMGRTTKVMAGSYRQVYRYARGLNGDRPVVAVVCPAAPSLDQANASTELRVWERTVNSTDRDCVFVRMTPHALMANLRDGIISGAILQREAIPSTMVEPLLEEMERNNVRFIFDLDDNLFEVSADKDPHGTYAAYRPALDALVKRAATVTTSTVPLQKALQLYNPRTILVPNRLSERLWRGKLPVREREAVIRALYMGSATHGNDFDMIAPALAAVAKNDPNFKVAVIGITDGNLPVWAERIIVPNDAKNYSQFIPWLKELSAKFDFALAPLTSAASNLYKSDLKAIDFSALGLPVLASDTPVFQNLGPDMHDVKLVASTENAWKHAVTDIINHIREGLIDRNEIRANTMHRYGLAQTLPEFDRMLISILSQKEHSPAPKRKDQKSGNSLTQEFAG
ncbi:hypothetical protein CP157_03561 (plasmid) [Paracoccus marcusii]|uniref:glycosyltransferase n=1 Tax=Paracoccus marcusii TaxID=59779 RepID=UPI001C3CC92F|nr:glycosyltransferase [Paracoccus marcusii]QXI65769.1 hypothetical protein CP157_03561 [Paracoccus marcusii]